jgi:hypothetical protein
LRTQNSGGGITRKIKKEFTEVNRRELEEIRRRN